MLHENTTVHYEWVVSEQRKRINELRQLFVDSFAAGFLGQHFDKDRIKELDESYATEAQYLDSLKMEEEDE